MQELVKNGGTPMLFPYEPAQYWQQIRLIIREEVSSIKKKEPDVRLLETPGLTYKPLLKITELCTLFQVTKPTIYAWIKAGKLKPVRVQSRVFFLFQDVQLLMRKESQDSKD